MQIPILNGIYTDESSDFRTSYPRNLVPVPKQQGISTGYLRPSDGIESWVAGPGLDRGGINWNGTCYRVMGTKLVSVSDIGTIAELGDISGTGHVSFDYSFDYLSIAADSKLYLYRPSSGVQQITDVDLGTVIDHIWVDGYFMTTDGQYLIVTELNNPFSVLPTKYGSSEADPDPIVALVKIRNEPYALNRYTIEAFNDIGGSGFPFQRIDGAQIQRGVIGTNACCLFMESVAFLGSGRNEPVSVYLASNGSSFSIATREIDQILRTYSEAVLVDVLMEARVDEGHRHLYLHLPDQTLVYDAAASQVLGEPVWFTLGSGILQANYRARNLVWCYDKWIVGDTQSYYLGSFISTSSHHWGEVIGWEFGTTIIYNEGMGAIIHELELVCLSGRVAIGLDPTISTEYSEDGETWSMVRFIKSGKRGERVKRLVWLNQGPMQHWRIQRFRGTSESHLSMARLEARIEPLAV